MMHLSYGQRLMIGNTLIVLGAALILFGPALAAMAFHASGNPSSVDLPLLAQEPPPLPERVALHVPSGFVLVCGAEETGAELGNGDLLWSGFLVQKSGGAGYEAVLLQHPDGSFVEVTPQPHLNSRGTIGGMAPGPLWLFGCNSGQGYAEQVHLP